MEVPKLTPVISPVDDPADTFKLLALHTPPVIASPNVITEPMQTADRPVIAAGTGFTVIVLVAVQPVTGAV
jgi:hypothetical protein